MRTVKRSWCTVLSLVLKRKWFEMIKCGEKREEYRARKPYWQTRLYNWMKRGAGGRWHVVEFRNGYRKDARRMAFLAGYNSRFEMRNGVLGVSSNLVVFEHRVEGDIVRHPEWGEPEGGHFAIHIGERLAFEGEQGGDHADA